MKTATSVTYYEENQYITNKEKQLPVKQWPSFQQIALQRKHGKKNIETYQKILKENSDDIKQRTLLLTIMMTISGSVGACQ